jgi:trimethylamine--corrinoid protein Co-methyltransferase
VDRIIGEALTVLAEVGVFVEHDRARAMLGDSGARIDGSGRAYLPEDLVWRSVQSAPSFVRLYNREGKPTMCLEGLSVHFDPGSAALKILDPGTGAARLPVTSDLEAFSRLTDALPFMNAQSTGLVPSDVPDAIADRYRLYLALLNSTKPIVTGTFTAEGYAVMREMLEVVAGSSGAARSRPMAIFDACSSQPLKWSSLTTQTLLDCAASGLPAELISVPLLGATAPVTLTGALVQHTAENVSGLVIHQIAGPGCPVIYGGSAAVLDMRHGTIAMGAVESMMLAAAYAQIGRRLGLPTHGYVGLSDAKTIDAQAGLESGMGAVLAALAGINMVSGAGMLEFENCQSLEKLVIDNEICGMAQRLVTGITPRETVMAGDLFSDLSEGGHFLTSPSTLQWLRAEVTFPGSAIDRRPRDVWSSDGKKDAGHHAREQVTDLLARHHPRQLSDETSGALTEIMIADARRHGLERLP